MGAVRRAALFLLCLVLAAQLCALWEKAGMDKRGEETYERVRAEAAGNGRAQEREGAGGIFCPDTGALRRLNEEYGAWLYIPGTSVDYPVTRPADNRRYLSRTFLGEENACGCLFFEASCVPGRSMNTVIHGHNMRSGSMFGGLKRYLEPEYGRNHGQIWLYIDEEWREYEVFSVYVTEETDVLPLRSYFVSGEEYREYVRSRRDRSVYEAGRGEGSWNGETAMLTLSTCHGRGKKLVVQAAQLGEQPET